MSEYELSLLRQRGIAARASKAQRGEYRFMLPPGFCWSELGKIEIDPDEHVAGVVRLVFTKFRELGSARQVFLWLRAADIKMPVVLRNVQIYKLSWKAPAYHEYDPASSDGKMISLAKAAVHFGICVGSAKSLVLKGILPATQAIKGSQWLVPVDTLSSEAVRIAVQRVIERRPKNYIDYQYDKMIRLPGI